MPTAAAVSFWQTRSSKLQDLVQASGRAFADYPLTIYPAGIRWLLTFVLPLALITYYPAQRLLGRNETGALLPVLSMAAVPVGPAAPLGWQVSCGGRGCGIIRARGRDAGAGLFEAFLFG